MKNKNIIMYIIVVLMIIGVIALGLYAKEANKSVDSKQSQDEKTETKKETNNNTKKESQQSSNEENQSKDSEEKNNQSPSAEDIEKHNVEYEKRQDSHFPNFEKLVLEYNKDVSKSFIMNSKNRIITIKHVVGQRDINIIVKLDDVELFDGWPENIDNRVYYRTIKGNDNKEYFLLGWTSYGETLKIYNEEGTELYRIKALENDELGCFVWPDDNSNLTEIKDNIIYFYRYVKGSKKTGNNNIKLEQVKLSINNNKVSEELTGVVVDGKFGQCVS